VGDVYFSEHLQLFFLIRDGWLLKKPWGQNG